MQGNAQPSDSIEGYYYFPVRFGNVNAGADISDTDILLVYNSDTATLVDKKPEIVEEIE